MPKLIYEVEVEIPSEREAEEELLSEIFRAFDNTVKLIEWAEGINVASSSRIVREEKKE